MIEKKSRRVVGYDRVDQQPWQLTRLKFHCPQKCRKLLQTKFLLSVYWKHTSDPKAHIFPRSWFWSSAHSSSPVPRGRSRLDGTALGRTWEWKVESSRRPSLKGSGRRSLSLLIEGQFVRVADAVAALSHQGALLKVQLNLTWGLDKGWAESTRHGNINQIKQNLLLQSKESVVDQT